MKIIQVEVTPNPRACKFYVDSEILKEGAFEIRKTKKSGVIFLDELLSLEWVDSIYVGNHFFTVLKNVDTDWQEFIPIIKEYAADYFSVSDWNLLTPNCQNASNWGFISEFFARFILPATEKDGGGIFLQGYDSKAGVVEIKISGACRGCPYTRETLLKGILRPLHAQDIGIKILREVE
ncbi:MAG: NifU N-terminal domain-containing protein [Bacteroidia bacterium]|nr:NifU N-terminal domain-containing protein [Bacteroidia bacterium]MDW8158660.1 NifU N-terminal domain-containing protein [Bacteroidia bacterium]